MRIDISMPPKILIFHHDRVYEALLTDFLVFCNYVVCPAYTHTDVIEQMRENDFDLVVLDLANENDLALVELFRKELPDLSPLLLVAPDTPQDIVNAAQGKNETIVQLPVPLVDILTLVRTMLEKQETQKLNARAPIQIGGLTIDAVNNTAKIDDQPLTLTVTEFSLLNLLASHCNEAVSKDDIYPTVLGRPRGQFDRSIDVHISSIRHKLQEAAGARFCIESVRGVGYRFKAQL